MLHLREWVVVVSQFNGTSTPKGSYSAKTGDNDCNVNPSRYSLSTALCESNSLSGKVWTKYPTRPDNQGAPQGSCSHPPPECVRLHLRERERCLMPCKQQRSCSRQEDDDININGTSTPKGSYSAKTGVNCLMSLKLLQSKNCNVWEHSSLSTQAWTKCPTRPDTQGAPRGGCSHFKKKNKIDLQTLGSVTQKCKRKTYDTSPTSKAKRQTVITK